VPTPTKFKAEVRQKIIQALSVGASRRTAAAIAGVDHEQIRRWMDKGKNSAEGTAYHEFYIDVISAEASPRMRALGVIYKELPDNPGLAWKFVERREPGYEAPIAAIQQPQATPVVVHLSFHDGSALTPSVVESFIEGEIVEQDEPAETRSLPAQTEPA
jgi:hypothetical protein